MAMEGQQNEDSSSPKDDPGRLHSELVTISAWVWRSPHGFSTGSLVCTNKGSWYEHVLRPSIQKDYRYLAALAQTKPPLTASPMQTSSYAAGPPSRTNYTLRQAPDSYMRPASTCSTLRCVMFIFWSRVSTSFFHGTPPPDFRVRSPSWGNRSGWPATACPRPFAITPSFAYGAPGTTEPHHRFAVSSHGRVLAVTLTVEASGYNTSIRLFTANMVQTLNKVPNPDTMTRFCTSPQLEACLALTGSLY